MIYILALLLVLLAVAAIFGYLIRTFGRHRGDGGDGKRKDEMDGDPVNPLEKILRDDPSSDPATRDGFYRELLRHDLYVPGEAPGEPDTFIELDSDTELKLQQWQFEEEWVVPVFSSEERLRNALLSEEGTEQEEIAYVQLYARDLFQILEKEETVLLNPRTSRSWTFDQTEIKGIVDGTIFETMKQIATESGVGFVGPSYEHPEELEEALRNLFETQRGVEIAWISQYYSPREDQPPHPAIGIDGSGDLLHLAAEADMRAREVLPEGSAVHLRQLSDDPVSQYMKEELEPFYTSSREQK